MQDIDALAEFGRLGVSMLSAVLPARGEDLDGPVQALFYQAGELSALSLVEPGQVSLTILLFALSEVSRDLADHEGNTKDFALFAQILQPDPREWAEKRAATFVGRGEQIGLPSLNILPEVHMLLKEAARLASSPSTTLTCNHIVAAFGELPQHALDQAIDAVGCRPDMFDDLVKKQLDAVNAQPFPGIATEAQLPESNDLEMRDAVGVTDWVEAEIRPAESVGVEVKRGAGAREEVNTELSLDDPEEEHDAFGRSVLAIGLARRLHRIWWDTNRREGGLAGDKERASFVLHLDSPWGGGKTTFAHFIARTLNPKPCGRPAARFLRERYGDADLGGIFLEDPVNGKEGTAGRSDPSGLPASKRRPWVVVSFNAWQSEHCSPPWWVFYQTIRHQCFHAVRTEGQRPWMPVPQDEGLLDGLRLWGERNLAWLCLWCGELGFRLTIPKIRALLLSAIFSLGTLLLLKKFGAWGMTADSKGALTSGFLLASGVGLLLAGVTGVGALWGLGAVLTEAIMPDSDAVSERIGLGKGDPFQRFKHHFSATIRRVKRPVLVIVDDLDRCNPAFVVDLIRGIQTVLRSSRVVFLILGDKEWIEAAFEAHYAAMKSVDVGPEQSLGARFVEKAIQMSFILPTPSDGDRAAYLRGVLLGTARPEDDVIDLAQTSKLREFTNRMTARPQQSPLESGDIVKQAMAQLEPGQDEASGAEGDRIRNRVEQIVNDTLAINATVDSKVESEIYHQLEALAGCFPANPRQVKRIVNAITIYYAVALQRPGLDPDAPFRRQLTLWLILMTEWPESWRLLASCPDLVDIIRADDPGKVFDELDAARRPGTRAATIDAVARIASDATLRSLIVGDGRGRDGLDASMVRVLAQLTPLHHRQPLLAETATS